MKIVEFNLFSNPEALDRLKHRTGSEKLLYLYGNELFVIYTSCRRNHFHATSTSLVTSYLQKIFFYQVLHSFHKVNFS